MLVRLEIGCSDDFLRSLFLSALSFLMHRDIKAATAVTITERQLFALFLTAHLNACSPGARQSIVASTAKMVTRLSHADPLPHGQLWLTDPVLWIAELAEHSLLGAASYQV